MVAGTPRGTIDGSGTTLCMGCGIQAGDDGSDRAAAKPEVAGMEVPGR